MDAGRLLTASGLVPIVCAGLVLLLASVTVPHAAYGQTVEEYAERVRHLVELRDRMEAVADSGDLAVSRAGGLDSIRVGQLLLYATKERLELVREAGTEAQDLLVAALGAEARILDSVSVTVGFSRDVVVSPPSQDRVALTAYSSVDRVDRVRQVLLSEVSELLNSRLDSTVRNWAGFAVQPADTTIDWRELWVEFATAPSSLVDACQTGGEPECRVALGLVRVEDPIFDWYDADGRREVVRGLPDNSLRDREAISVCLERGWDQICVAVLEGLDHIRPPLSYPTRQAFLRFALTRTPGGFGRLLRIGGAADSAISMAGVLVDVAQEDLSALIRDWRGRIVDGRPEAVSVGWRTTVSTVVWVSILLSVRLAASRWRRRPRASPRGES
jgi:hypothetical protein